MPPSDEPHPLRRALRWLGWLFVVAAGTLGALSVLLVVGFFAWLVVVLTVWEFPGWEGRKLPPKIGVARILDSSEQRGGYLEGCWYALYQLTPATIRDMKREGPQYFSGMTRAPDDSDFQFRTWRQTPLKSDGPVFATNARSGCDDDVKKHRGAPPYPQPDPLEEPGSYYSLTGNGEGVIVVSPSRGIAIFLYFG